MDSMGPSRQANVVRGNHRTSLRPVSSKDLVTLLTAKPAKMEHEAILIIINRPYQSDMSDEELYEARRGIWKIGARRRKVEVAVAVDQGIIREVYEIKRWLPAGTLRYKTRDSRDFNNSQRWEFEGEIAHNIRSQYIDPLCTAPIGQEESEPDQRSKRTVGQIQMKKSRSTGSCVEKVEPFKLPTTSFNALSRLAYASDADCLEVQLGVLGSNRPHQLLNFYRAPNHFTGNRAARALARRSSAVMSCALDSMARAT
jgi:hypothetical protein